MSVITFNQMGRTIDEIRAAVIAADGPEYGLCRSPWRMTRVYDWHQHRWRLLPVAELGCKQPSAAPMRDVPDNVRLEAGTSYTEVMEYIEAVGSVTPKILEDEMGLYRSWLNHHHDKYPGTLKRERMGLYVDGVPQHTTIYRVLPGWREVYEEKRLGLKPEHKELLAWIKAHPGGTPKVMAEEVGQPYATTMERLKTLGKKGLVMRKKVGRKVQCWIAEEVWT